MRTVMAVVGRLAFFSLTTLALIPGAARATGITNTGSIDFAAGDALVIEILGPTVGAQYDQINVTGTVSLTGPLSSGSATLTVIGTYVPNAGEQFVILNNDGVDAISGQFAGLPNGGLIAFNGRALRIDYFGGDGNDVVLTAQSRWIAASDSSWINAANWENNTLPSNGVNGSALIDPCCAITTINQDSGGVWGLGALRFASSAQFTGGSGFNFASGGANLNSITADAGATGSLDVPVTLGTTLNFGGEGNLVFSQGLTGLGGGVLIRKIGTGTVDVASVNPHPGRVNVEDGTLNYSPLTTAPITRELLVQKFAVPATHGIVHTGPASWAAFTAASSAGDIILTGDVELTGGTLPTSTFGGSITGTHAIRATGGGHFFNGTNAFTGGLTVENGAGVVLNGANAYVPGGAVTINGTGYLAVSGVAGISTLDGTAVASVSVGSGTTSGGVELSGTITGTGIWNLPAGHIRVLSGTTTATDVTAGKLHVETQLTANDVVANNELTGSGTLAAASLTVNSTSDTTFSGNISGPAGSLTKTGPGTLTLSGSNTYQGTTAISGGTLSVTGALTGGNLVFVNSGGRVEGTGSIIGPVTVNAGGTLAPGISGPGILATGAINYPPGGGNLAVDITGTTAGTQYDRINVTGQVVLNSPNLVLSGSYVPVLGDQFTIIDNDGADSVIGTFSGLAENATMPFNGRFLRVSYVGGTGNDIVLSTATSTVTLGAVTNGTLAPVTALTVISGDSVQVTITPSVGYSIGTITGCAGSLAGNTFTTNALVADCTLDVAFTLNTYNVTPSAIGSGTITPNTVQVVGHGATTQFTVTASPGFSTAVGGTCGGSLVGTTYTTAPITGACTVVATFGTVTTFSGPSPTGTGTINASFTGGGGSCTFTMAQFIPVTGNPASPPGPAPAQFPHGLFDFALGSCTPASTITMTITYPQALPADTQYWKYGPTPANRVGGWYVLPATITGNTVVFTITDGGLGDDDLAADGAIIDQGGPGNPGPPGTPNAIPTLSEWMLLVLASLLLLAGLRRVNPSRAGRSMR